MLIVPVTGHHPPFRRPTWHHSGFFVRGESGDGDGKRNATGRTRRPPQTMVAHRGRQRPQMWVRHRSRDVPPAKSGIACERDPLYSFDGEWRSCRPSSLPDVRTAADRPAGAVGVHVRVYCACALIAVLVSDMACLHCSSRRLQIKVRSYCNLQKGVVRRDCRTGLRCDGIGDYPAPHPPTTTVVRCPLHRPQPGHPRHDRLSSCYSGNKSADTSRKLVYALRTVHLCNCTPPVLPEVAPATKVDVSSPT